MCASPPPALAPVARPRAGDGLLRRRGGRHGLLLRRARAEVPLAGRPRLPAGLLRPRGVSLPGPSGLWVCLRGSFPAAHSSQRLAAPRNLACSLHCWADAAEVRCQGLMPVPQSPALQTKMKRQNRQLGWGEIFLAAAQAPKNNFFCNIF